MKFYEVEGHTYFIQDFFILENNTTNKYTTYFIFDVNKKYLPELSKLYTHYYHVDTNYYRSIFEIFPTFLLSPAYVTHKKVLAFNNNLDKLLEEE